MTKTPKRAYARIGGITAGVGVLFAGGVLIASTPAFADNGPHVSMTATAQQGSIGGALGGGCASCHRAHSAQAKTDLLKTSDEIALCQTCHAGSGNGATTNVMDGVAYNGTTGALRSGGFTNAAIDSGNGVRTPKSGSTSINKPLNVIGVAKVNGVIAPSTSSSQHSLGVAGQTMWGNGAFSASANYGKTNVTLECSSCHDPHGNGNFRILKPMPSTGGVGAGAIPAITSASSASNTITYTLTAPAQLNTGQTVTVAGNANAAFNVTNATISSKTDAPTSVDGQFLVSAFSVVVATAPASNSGAGGTVNLTIPDVKPGDLSASVTKVEFVAAGTRDPATVKYTVSANPFPARSMVSVVNNTNSTANVTASVYKSTATSFSFDAADVPGAATGLAGTGGTATAPKLAYDYTTTNYWLNDPNAQAPLNASGTSSFIASASQWCSTCHTRYLSTSGGTSREVASGDSVFTYRHTSASGSQDSPNCIQCHVAHGSNAVMSGTSGSDEANSPQMNPDDPTANPLVYSNGDHGSKLLRVNNRGICQMCHNK